MAKRHKDLKIPEGVSPGQDFVQILDPATGTGTFLVEVIDLIHKTLVAKWKAQGHGEKKIDALWNEYVPKHLLTRLHGYELLMAPYAIAHLKIGLKLYETGYRFGSDERARVYLTNALEPESALADVKAAGLFEALGHEAQAVNAIKHRKRFTVVIGNPPYSHMTANPSEELRGIVDIYRDVDGEPIRERGAIMFERTLQDDYVKFHALADRLTAGRPAIRAYITNSAYLDNPTHRGMRCHLMHAWESLWLLDLHGDVKRAGDGDHNVFDIRTGVAIGVFLRLSSTPAKAQAVFSELSGTRDDKYRVLSKQSIHTTEWSALSPQTPYYLFRPQSGASLAELDGAPLIHDVFLLKSEAIKTNRDHFVIGDSDDEILKRIRVFIDPAKTTADVKGELALNDNAQWSVDTGRRECRTTFNKSHLAAIAYRPFDVKRIYYHPSVVFNPRPVLAENVLGLLFCAVI
jgi:predicted helicase